MIKRWILLFILFPTFAFCQDEVYGDAKQSKKIKIDSAVSRTGFVVKEGDKILVGRGSQDDGSFKYIVRNQAGFGTMMTTADNINNNASRKRIQNDNDLPKAWNGYEVTVVKFRKYGAILKPIVVFKGMQLGMKWEIDLDAAIELGEIIVPEKFKHRKESSNTIVQQPMSKADEILKLKKLLDDGILTKEEFDAEKKKLLEK